MTRRRGIVYLVGAGPGDPELITVRGLRVLRAADVVVFDRLIGERLLWGIRSDAERINVGKRRGSHRLSQDEIQEVVVKRARQGKCVVRLKGGDPFVFGRGFEELAACREAGVDCIVIPGVTSAVAAPHAAGIPLTLRNVASSFAVVTAERGGGCSGEAIGFDASAFGGVDTLVILMGRAGLPRIVDALTESGRSTRTPVACVERASLPDQRIVKGTLADIVSLVEQAGLEAPMVTIVGDVAALATAVPSAPEAQGGLAGKRIIVTRPRSTSRELLERLSSEGALPIDCPMTRIVYPEVALQLDEALRRLGDYHWIVFSSVHGVKGTWRRMSMLAFDARRLGNCKVAAVGARTQRELRRRGIIADCLPEFANGRSLAAAIASWGPMKGLRVLFPCGDIARTTIPSALRTAGALVDAPIAYITMDATPPEDSLQQVRRGADAVVFCSPSAVRRFVSLGLGAAVCPVVCIGPSTAETARELGLGVDAVSRQCDNDGLIEALRCCIGFQVVV